MVSTKPGTYSGVPGMAWKGTLRKPLYPDTAMSHETIPAIATRIEHWHASFLDANREFSESDTCSPTFLIFVSCETMPSSAIQLPALPA